MFGAANGYGMPIVVHTRSSITAKLPYGRDEAADLLERDSAGCAGRGGADRASGRGWRLRSARRGSGAGSVRGRHCQKGPTGARLWFDVTTVVLPKTPAGTRRIDRAADTRAGRSARALWIGRADRGQPSRQGRMGGVSHAAADRGPGSSSVLPLAQAPRRGPHHRHDGNRGHASEHDRRHSAEPLRGQAALHGAPLIRAGDEQAVHRRHPPS